MLLNTSRNPQGRERRHLVLDEERLKNSPISQASEYHTVTPISMTAHGTLLSDAVAL